MSLAVPGWFAPVAAIFILQTTTAFLARLIPIVAPAMSNEFGWDGSSIGYLTAANSLGGLAILVGGSTLLKQIGGMRTMQFTLLLGAASMALFLHPSISIALAACFLMGLSNGTANPAGSEVLQRFSPPDKRNLIFSIKQAGVPLGGVIAGLVIPSIVLVAGWRAAVFACAFLVILTTVLTWRIGGRLDESAASRRRLFSLPNLESLRALRVPLQSLAHSRGLLKMSVVGSLFAVSQSCWFTFTVIYLIDELDFSLGLAGIVFAIMQVGGVIGRIVLGWISDRVHSATATLSIAAIVSAATTVLLGVERHHLAVMGGGDLGVSCGLFCRKLEWRANCRNRATFTSWDDFRNCCGIQHPDQFSQHAGSYCFRDFRRVQRPVRLRLRLRGYLHLACSGFPAT